MNSTPQNQSSAAHLRYEASNFVTCNIYFFFSVDTENRKFVQKGQLQRPLQPRLVSPSHGIYANSVGTCTLPSIAFSNQHPRGPANYNYHHQCHNVRKWILECPPIVGKMIFIRTQQTCAIPRDHMLLQKKHARKGSRYLACKVISKAANCDNDINYSFPTLRMASSLMKT